MTAAPSPAFFAPAALGGDRGKIKRAPEFLMGLYNI
jgi:hypothetical protein